MCDVEAVLVVMSNWLKEYSIAFRSKQRKGREMLQTPCFFTIHNQAVSPTHTENKSSYCLPYARTWLFTRLIFKVEVTKLPANLCGFRGTSASLG